MSGATSALALAKSILAGITPSEETDAIKGAVTDLDNKVDWENVTLDAVKTLVPAFGLYCDIAQVVLVLAPASKPADWDAAVNRAKSPNPNDPDYVMGQGD